MEIGGKGDRVAYAGAVLGTEIERRLVRRLRTVCIRRCSALKARYLPSLTERIEGIAAGGGWGSSRVALNVSVFSVPSPAAATAKPINSPIKCTHPRLHLILGRGDSSKCEADDAAVPAATRAPHNDADPLMFRQPGLRLGDDG